MEILTYSVGLFILGAILGSFAVATVWRLRAWQLAADKKHGEKLSKEETAELAHLTKLRGKKGTKDRQNLCPGRALITFPMLVEPCEQIQAHRDAIHECQFFDRYHIKLGGL